MKQILITLIFASLVALITAQFAQGEVWIPENEFAGYYDFENVFTVVGTVKNSETFSIAPKIEIKINDDGNTISESFVLPIANPAKDIPFKIKFPQVSSKNPILEKPAVYFTRSAKETSDIQVVYDKTLIKHADGHTSGFIVNNGSQSTDGIRVYALIHGKDGRLLDVGKSLENIRIEPGQKIAFSIYPEPLFADQVNYYSCFVIGDDTIIPTFTIRDGKRFDFRYDSSAYFNDFKFNNSDTLEFFARNPWPIEVYVNFEFPMESDSQKFEVHVDKEKIDLLQSRDEFTNWHVAFNLKPQSSNKIEISGFESKKENTQSEFDSYYLLGIIPVAVIITILIIIKKKRI